MMQQVKEFRILAGMNLNIASTILIVLATSAAWAAGAPAKPSVPISADTPSSAVAGASQGAPAAPAPIATPVPPPPSFTLPQPSAANEPPFLESFPQLKDYIYREPSSGFYLGVGLSPIGLLKDRLMLTADFFQVHWLSERWDLELFNAAFSLTRAQSTSVESTQFTLRTAPKYRLFEHLSIGPVIGYEFVSFPNISAQLRRDNLFSPSEPFSSRGWIYGAMVTETFKLSGNYILQINEVGYQQTYSTSQTAQGWNYYFNNADIRNDTSQIQATTVFMVDASFLY